ncbi:unknown [Clostridium sp. CAG:356]|nr:unknown [Clostridium sp. CAG:356]
MSRKSGIVNVRMVITEEKILSNIDKVQKLINPKSKKQIVQLDDDTYFKDLIESIKAYLIEYPKKKNFPASVYKAAYGLVEYATIQFEENTKKVEELIRQREENIALAGTLRELVEAVENKDSEWKDKVEENKGLFSEDLIDTLKLVGKDRSRRSQNYKDAIKLLNARVSNLETNLHIEIDMERTEDKSKALSYIGIEIAVALKDIPRPADLIIEETPEEETETPVVEKIQVEEKKAKKTTKAATAKTAKKKANIEEAAVVEAVEAKPKARAKTKAKAENVEVIETKAKTKATKSTRVAKAELIDVEPKAKKSKVELIDVEPEIKVAKAELIDVVPEIEEAKKPVKRYVRVKGYRVNAIKENEEPKEEKVEIIKEQPKQEVVPKKKVSQLIKIEENEEDTEVDEQQAIQDYQESVTFEKKPSLWQRIKNSKLGRVVSYVLKIRIRIELPNALPEGRGEE